MNTTASTILPTQRLASERSMLSPLETMAAPAGRGAGVPGALSPFDLAERLVQAWSRNERRLDDLDGLDAGIAEARRRLATTTAGRTLVEAHLARLLARRAATAASARDDAALAEELSREWDARHAVRRAVGG
jgi:hypothetical protein